MCGCMMTLQRLRSPASGLPPAPPPPRAGPGSRGSVARPARSRRPGGCSHAPQTAHPWDWLAPPTASRGRESSAHRGRAVQGRCGRTGKQVIAASKTGDHPAQTEGIRQVQPAFVQFGIGNVGQHKLTLLLGQGLCSDGSGSGCGAGSAPVTAKAGSPPSTGSGVSLEATLSSSRSSVVTFPAIAAGTTTTFTRPGSLIPLPPCAASRADYIVRLQGRMLPRRRPVPEMRRAASRRHVSRRHQPVEQCRQLPRPW
jgi:hypothetical protein